jgi:hypothetical protein
LNKIEEAKDILASFGLPDRQQTDRSARVLLALAGIKKKSLWKDATNELIGIHNIIIFISEKYDFPYAENSRESIRRQSIHQFEQAGIIVRNADDPGRPTNSGKTVYSLTPIALGVIKSYGTSEWPLRLKKFISNVSSLVQKCHKERKIHQVTIKIRNKEYYLSSGKHNILQKDILKNFAPRFAKGSILIYMGDTARKLFYLDAEYCEKLNIDITKHDKLPDIVLYHHKKKWLYLIEAVTSHGPVSDKRMIEIEEMLSDSSVHLIFVSAFPDFKTFQKYASEISWETEVWISNSPDHIIHFNGDKFLGPEKI